MLLKSKGFKEEMFIKIRNSRNNFHRSNYRKCVLGESKY